MRSPFTAFQTAVREIASRWASSSPEKNAPRFSSNSRSSCSFVFKLDHRGYDSTDVFGMSTVLFRMVDGFFIIGGGVQHFLFVSPKRKRWQKKKATGGFRFPPDPLKRPGKPLWFSWTFPAPGFGLAEPTMHIAHGGKRDGT